MARATVGLALALGLSALAGCDDVDDRGDGRWDRFGSDRRGGRDGWDGRDRWDPRDRWDSRGRGGPQAPDSPDAAVGLDAGLADAGSDAGLEPIADAGSADAGSLVPGSSDPGSAGSGPVDAGVLDPAFLALSDGQILAVADALLAGPIEQARAAEPSLSDAAVLAFAEQTIAEREAARSTLAALGQAIGLVDAPSSVANDVLAENAAALAPAGGADAGALDAEFLSARVVGHGRTLERLDALIAAVDAPALRAQLVVLHALEGAALERATALAAAL